MMGYFVVVVDHFVFCFYEYISILIARQRYEKKSSIVQLKNVTSAHGMERKPGAFCRYRKASKNMENFMRAGPNEKLLLPLPVQPLLIMFH